MILSEGNTEVQMDLCLRNDSRSRSMLRCLLAENFLWIKGFLYVTLRLWVHYSPFNCLWHYCFSLQINYWGWQYLSIKKAFLLPWPYFLLVHLSISWNLFIVGISFAKMTSTIQNYCYITTGEVECGGGRGQLVFDHTWKLRNLRSSAKN